MNGIQPLQPGLSRPKPWRLILWSAAALLLLVPVVAMPFTAQMNWGAEDFFAAAALIWGAGLAIELAVRFLRTTTHRLATIAVVLLGFLLIWAELAVGVLH